MKELREIWARGGCALNGWLALPCAFSAELLSKQAWDSLTIDMQHGLVDYATMTTMLTATATRPGLPALARTPWLDEGFIMRTLDAGAAGIICPMINTPDDAKRFADCVRYPPIGRRSYGPARAMAHYGADYFSRANDEVVALAMVETAEAVANIDAILATVGIDGVYIGPSDLAVSLGYAPSFTPSDAAVLDAIATILAAAKKHGKVAGMHTNDAATAAMRREQGFDLVTAGTDTRLLADASANLLRQLK